VGNFTTWPTLTAEHVNKYLEKSEATVKGHLNQTRKNVRSTKPKKRHNKQEDAPDYEPHITERTNVVYAAIHTIDGHTYTDLTDRFRTTSSRGYKYILVLYDYDGKRVHAEPMKNRSDAEAIRAYSRIYDELTSKGLKPKFQTMDNEASTAMKQFLH
jgi:ABC-type transporter MlaC component